MPQTPTQSAPEPDGGNAALGHSGRDATPRRRWPAEWEPHRATWLSWPHNVETWPRLVLGEVEDAFCEIVRAIAPGETVEINVADGAMAERVRARLRGAGVEPLERVRFRGVPTDDAWVRDHGGIVVFESDASEAERVADGEVGAGRRRVLLDFEYDSWGGKYPPWDRDAAVGEQMARIARLPRVAIDWVLEGGSIEGDGAGTILTTESCLLDPKRARAGQARTRATLEALLSRELGAEQVLWLASGIAGDDTDGHIDDLTRFVAPGHVVTVVANDPAHVDFGVLEANRARLASMVDAAGRALEVVELPVPAPLLGPEGPLPASYANFYFANAALLVPVFDRPSDREAIAILERLVRDRPIVPIPSARLVMGLGSVHCLTQQEPALVSLG